VTTGQLNRITPLLIGLAWLVALAAGWRRSSRDTGYPWIGVSAAMLCAFLLFNKVHSPQYTLWLLPFFVLIRVRWGWWVAYLSLDVVLYVGLFRWYYDITRGGDFGVAKQATIVGVWGKAVMLALLYVLFLRSQLAVRSTSDGSPSADPPGLPAPGSTATPEPSDVDSAAAGTDQAYAASGAPSSTPPAGSSTPDARTTSPSGRRTSRTTSAASTTTATSRTSTAPRNQL
jgi:hypothetical protein